ncbi:MAG: LysM peptidoglycan-binding domain-containing protein [bacterium]|nr:LysM peptidoglycan-binding domain-containing protein [bacterium]
MNAKKIFTLMIAAVFVFTCCGGNKKHKPETEPSAPLERFEPPQAPQQETEKQEETTPPVTPVTPVTPTEQETIPVIQPEKKPEEVPDSISAGIADIFKEFGYPGDIDLPVNFKRRVAHYIRYFSFDDRGAPFYNRCMARAARYLPMIRETLQKKHLPLSLAYLPLVESGFIPTARSRAGAVGMWQFMRGTARMYGLKVTRRLDERKDPEKSTHAAAEYLNDLLAMFGQEDPFLGICAYNAGEGKILNALRKISYKERSFWTLVKKNLLRNETDEYIPQLLAVILMTGDPEHYAAASKDVPVEPDEEEDRAIIASLQGDSSPSQSPAEEIEIEPAPPTVHKVKRGDTLYSIARKYNTRVKTLKKWNRLRGNRIRPGQKLKLYASATAAASPRSSRKKGKGYKLIYTVNYKDSLARIALFFKGVSARDIMKWNRLRRTRIYPKQKLALYLKQAPRKVLNHKIKRGETAGKIARRYGRPLGHVLSLNGLVTDSRLKPGKRLKIYYF